MNNSKYKLLGPFSELLTMRQLPLRGALSDSQLEIIKHGGIVIKNGYIVDVDSYANLKQKYDIKHTHIEMITGEMVALPAFVDAHTHICYAGSRANDFAARNEGKSYLEIAKGGGGIWQTVKDTRKATKKMLIDVMNQRISSLLKQGITTVEVKSGYGLNVEDELKMLEAIYETNQNTEIDIISTCLAAHTKPQDFLGSAKDYLNMILTELVPIIKQKQWCNRFDIFVEEGAFDVKTARYYLEALKTENFDLVVHGDQFTVGGSQVAMSCGAVSVDHLEASGKKEIDMLAQSDICPIVLPGCSLGLGCRFAPARQLLDAGCSLVIASDWNPGSAPMGHLLTQASILSVFEKLTTTEVLAGITYRAANVLKQYDRGVISSGKIADIIAFPCKDYREILYHQGTLQPKHVWKLGTRIYE